jgi:hypothetical protein
MSHYGRGIGRTTRLTRKVNGYVIVPVFSITYGSPTYDVRKDGRTYGSNLSFTDARALALSNPAASTEAK